MRRAVKEAIAPGAAGGLAGGLVFGAAMIDLGSLSSVASIIRVESPYVGFLVNMTIAAIVGAGLGVIVWRIRPGLGETLLWGLAYGTFWWFIGSLTLHPLVLSGEVDWSAEAAQAAFPALLGHVLYGSTAAMALVAIKGAGVRRFADTITIGCLIRGALAGLLAAWIIGLVLAAQGHLPTLVARMPADSRLAMWMAILLIGLIAGISYSASYPETNDGAGAGVIRGAMLGFLLWVIVPLSLLPAVNGHGLPWSANEIREVFPSMPGYVLLGAILALLHQWLTVLNRTLFSDLTEGGDQEGVGTEGLRAAGYGGVAGLVGGLLFTGVMAQTGAFGTVASLIGATSPVTGFFVHMTIAVLVGASYGLLFRRHSHDVGSALGWGLSYGFIWWILGPLTLMPAFLGSTPQWTADVAALVFPNLIGHLAYGGGIGVALYLLEARYRPWWVPQARASAELIERRREQVTTSAPALWTLVVIISLTLPVLLGPEAPVSVGPSGY